jgi:phenylacetate-CoA ligase
MPIIRYKIGDLAAMCDTECACGRTLPTMTPPMGRVLDYLKRRDGKMYYGNLFIHTLLSKVNNNSITIKQLQVIQKDYDKFVFNIVPGKEYSRDILNLFSKECKSAFGNSSITEIRTMEEIPRAKSGKLRTVICEI